MRITLVVSDADDVRSSTSDLRQWLGRDPELRPRMARAAITAPEPGSMGAAQELVSLVLEPGGVAATLGAALVAWLQNRRGNRTVTITLPDGTSVTVASERVRGLTAEGTGEVAAQVAESIRQRAVTARESEQTQEEESSDRAVPAEGTDLPDQPGRAGT
ncbi:hypothetical protein ACIO1C_00810 [Streptomyces sp. NPDC087420]|uniref:effector-associated constant component EACC1 n=1 Tax=Streptomyces sp. NPDC087420 TaxID=3365785 RepID=UPI00383259C3